ncbi:MAG: NAD(P)-dependent alcohol dehydrogenase [bacterium]|nr:NAD(P)-dependent alcohol dehydrogenase [bacterium]
MKAIVYTKYGPPDVLQLKEVETPTPGDNEVLIKVFSSSVNRTDCAMLRAKPFIMRFFTGVLRPKNPILGTDFAGTIEAVGRDVDSLHVGEKVFGFDDSGLRSHAQYMTLSQEKGLATMPQNMSYEHAVACLEGAHYAYNFLNKVDLKPGRRVLVNGATGAIGSAAVQLLKNVGADVTAVCRGKHADVVRSLGAARVIDYTQEDFTQRTEKYDYIFDAVGKSSFMKCTPLLHAGGVYISSELGPMAQNLFFALMTPIFGRKKVIFPLPTDCRRSVLFIKKLCEEGLFHALIDRTYSLEEIANAYRYVETGQKMGNVVITVGHNDNN